MKSGVNEKDFACDKALSKANKADIKKYDLKQLSRHYFIILNFILRSRAINKA
jgi:hypothetical protein